MTRALAGRLINGIAAVIEESSIEASQASDDVRSDLVLLEHHKAVSPPPQRQTQPNAHALSEPPKVSAPARPQGRLAQPPMLITSIDIVTFPSHFGIVVKTGNEVMARFDTSREELHRLLDLLIRKAEEANWRLPVKAEWLMGGKSLAAIN